MPGDLSQTLLELSEGPRLETSDSHAERLRHAGHRQKMKELRPTTDELGAAGDHLDDRTGQQGAQFGRHDLLEARRDHCKNLKPGRIGSEHRYISTSLLYSAPAGGVSVAAAKRQPTCEDIMSMKLTGTLLFLSLAIGCSRPAPGDAATSAPAAGSGAPAPAAAAAAPTEGTAAPTTGSGAGTTNTPPAVAQVEITNPMEAPADVAAPPADAVLTASGLASKVIRPGTGTATPTAASTVTVHYSGWTTDGQLFDSSHRRRQPATFGLNQVIPGWTEGVQLMVEGETRRFWIPEALAYQGQPGAPAGMLVFDVELISIVQPPEAPADVAAAPADAEVTATGLASRVLQAGTGTTRPTATSRVRVHYSGWTTDGNMFDSSVTRGEPAEFGLNQVIPGWTEGVQLMVEGEKRRFWIPVELAYNNRPGRPAGMLVFDVELLSIVN